MLRLRTALFATARPEGLARGLKVSAKGVGIPELKAMRGNIGIKLDVALLPRKDYTIAFKFLRHLDQSGSHVVYGPESPGAKKLAGCFSKGCRT